MLHGKIVNRNGTLYVLYKSVHDSEPEITYLFWKIEWTGASWGGFERPAEGDIVTSTQSGHCHWHWKASNPATLRSTGDVWTAEGPAAHSETVSAPTPKVRANMETRWYRGAWEKYSKAKGWIPA